MLLRLGRKFKAFSAIRACAIHNSYNYTLCFRRQYTQLQYDYESDMATKKETEVAVRQSSNNSLKVPKGTRDWFGSDVLLREYIFSTISDIFKKHGASPLDTPVFELKDVLTGKYGEDSKLIYDLADQGGEISALRFDLTVPFARWLAMNKVEQVKRYQIAKVYRRDQPAMTRGRLREFYQCDFDIAGIFDPMIPDAEILRIISETFNALEIKTSIKMNHRKILDGVFAVAGVKPEMIRTISSAVDKLDKVSWDEVKKEMIEKGLEENVADNIGEYVKHSGTIEEMIKLLQADEKLMANETIKAGLADMTLLGKYLQALNVTTVTFDMALARGLDYYTGLIYEVKYEPPAEPAGKKSKNSDANHVGSIAAGGRYDNLCGIFNKKQIPCVGISFGVDRIFTILKARQEKELRKSQVDVYVMAFGGKDFDGMLTERMSVITKLWDAGIRAEFVAKVKPKLPQQFKAAENAGVTLAVILGQDEHAAGQVRVKVLGLDDGHPEKDGVLVDQANMIQEIQRRLT